METTRGRNVLLVRSTATTTGCIHCDNSLCRFKLLTKTDLDGENASDGDSERIIRTNAFGRGVLALPGTVFLPNGRKTGYVRASFSLSSPEDVEEAVKRLRAAVLDAQA